MTDHVIDLRSDRVETPPLKMRKVMARVGAEGIPGTADYYTTELERRIARLFEMETALLLNSGRQGNLICSLVHCDKRGQAWLGGAESHMVRFEKESINRFGGTCCVAIRNESNGTFCLETVKEKLKNSAVKLVCIENTHNLCGGRVLPLDWLDKLTELCGEHNIPIHMDGARIFNASIATGVPVSRIVRGMSSVMICLDKGLGSPVGSIIIGSEVFIQKARLLCKDLGINMGKIASVAVAGLYSLDHMIVRLKDDHYNAKLMATAIYNSTHGKGVVVNTASVDTNIVLLHLDRVSALDFCKSLESNAIDEDGFCKKQSAVVKCFPMSEKSVRIVLHCNISKEMVEYAIEKICCVINNMHGEK